MDDTTDISQQSEVRYSILSKDGTLKYDFMTSLQKIAMVRIVSSLWINQNIQQKILYLYRRRKWMMFSIFVKMEDDIVAKVSQLLLPNPVCEELKKLITVLEQFIVDWMRYHDDHVFVPEISEYSAVDFIHNITWTTRGKIDYLQTAKNILANSDMISDDHKYRLACTYCFEDEISLLSSKMVSEFYSSCIYIDREPMVHFWSTQIRGDLTQLNNPRYYWDRNQHHNAMSYNEHILQLLIKHDGADKTINEVPIKFMWSKLSKEEKAKNIALFKKVNNPDYIISLLSNLNYDQQQNFLKECSYALLDAILKEWWWWENYFLPTALNVLDIIEPRSFWRVLWELNRKQGMSSEKDMYDHFKSLFILLWQEGSTQFKEFISQDKKIHLEDFVMHELNWERDGDIIKVIFKDLNKQLKKNIVFGNDGIERCTYFIQHDKWNLLDLFIKCTLSSEEDINELKHKLMEHSGKKITVSFLKRREIHKLERFMNWSFKTEEEISNFYQSLSYCAVNLIRQW